MELTDIQIQGMTELKAPKVVDSQTATSWYKIPGDISLPGRNYFDILVLVVD
jgi:hypothetical protein